VAIKAWALGYRVGSVGGGLTWRLEGGQNYCQRGTIARKSVEGSMVKVGKERAQYMRERSMVTGLNGTQGRRFNYYADGKKKNRGPGDGHPKRVLCNSEKRRGKFGA